MNNNHAIPPGITVLVALMLGVFYAYVVPWLYRFETSEVIVAEKWIRLLSGDKPNDLRYEKMSSCQIVSHEIEGQKISILAVVWKKGGTTILGIDPSVSIQDLQRVLSERGVYVEVASDSEEESVHVPNLL